MTAGGITGEAEHRITDVEDLRSRYGTVSERAAGKVHPALDGHDRAFVAASPFLVLATADPGGLLDVSPRGDRPGFVTVLDDGRLVLPDRPGNNRLDSLLNVLADTRVSLIFFVPGADHTLRVNGTGSISTHPDLLALGEVRGRRPVTALLVEPAEVLYQCPRALARSGLWGAGADGSPGLPSLDEVFAAQVPGLTLERSLALGRASRSDPLW